MFRANQPIVLTDFEQAELRRRSRSQRLRAEDVQRARLILMLADGESYREISERLRCSPTWINRWRQRFIQARLAGLYSKHHGRKVHKRTPALQAKILDTLASRRRMGRLTGVHARWQNVWEPVT